MDAFQLLEEARAVAPADDAAVDAAVDLVLTAAFADVGTSPTAAVRRRRRCRRLVRGAAALTAAAVAALVAVLVVGTGGPPGSGAGSPQPPRSTTVPTRPGGVRNPALLAASTVRHIAAATTAIADSGTAVETETTSTGTPPVTQTTTTDVTFSGKNVNYAIATNSDGAQGVQNRYVDGQFYLYVKGPDLQMHWYHTLDPGSANRHPFFDPRTVFPAVSPAAGFAVVGHATVGGLELTELSATKPGSVSAPGIPSNTGPVTSLDVWIDSSDVVHRMTVVIRHDLHACKAALTPSSSAPPASPSTTYTIHASGTAKAPIPKEKLQCTTVTIPGSRTLTVAFANLGAPESVTVPAGAIPQHALGSAAGSPALSTPAPSGPSGTGALTSFPAPLATAARALRPATEVPVLLPAAVPPGLSATTTASPTSYRVSLYDCGTPLPLNDRQIGSGTCAAFSHFFGSVAGVRYASAGAAQQALRAVLRTEPLGCPRTESTLQHRTTRVGRTTVVVRSTKRRVCSDSWTEHGWSVELVGWFLPNDHDVKWFASALSGLAEGHGSVVVDIPAFTRDHTSIDFRKHNVTYEVTNRTLSVAVAMVASMTT